MDSKYSLSDCTSLSVVCAVDKFIKSVEAMNETVMVPSRLLNVEPPENGEKVPALLRGGGPDPYTFYTILNNVKTNLVWGVTDNDEVTLQHQHSHTDKIPNDNMTWFVPSTNGRAQSSVDQTHSSSSSSSKESPQKGHARRISSVSTASIVSSVSEQESCCERLSDAGDSGVESEETDQPPADNATRDVTSTLKNHLVGLQTCLSRLTETAAYITERYQEEVSA